MRRVNKIEYYLNIAKEVSMRSTCIRRQYGAIIVSNDEIISTGYNGSPRGLDNCNDTNECIREKLKIPSGERYELCVAVHAEQNAIISASRRDMIGSYLYLFGRENYKTLDTPKPCAICSKLILNSGIEKVITKNNIFTRNDLTNMIILETNKIL